MYGLIYALVYITIWGVFIGGLDDLFSDILYFVLRTINGEKIKIKLEDLDKVEEKPIAIFLPAWREAEVIEDMIKHNVSSISYSNYHIFIGVYPNDFETKMKVAKVERIYPNVHMALVPHDGPTNKADNLNWIYQNMLKYEQDTGKKFDVVLMHDAEDIIHPLSLKLVNYLADEYDMIQIPVFSLEVPFRNFTAGTYMDEFAEHHLKEIYVRYVLGGFVPSAGVGTAFSRRILERLAKEKNNMLFDTDSLTEDYVVGKHIKDIGGKQVLLKRVIRVKRHSKWLKILPGFLRKHFEYKNDFIATREYFPFKFSAAIRQKTRWMLGIIFQGTEKIKWRGRAIDKFYLYKDRKGVWSSIISFLTNVLFIAGWTYVLLGKLLHTGWNLSRFIPGEGIIWWVIFFNTVMLFERLLMKVYAVTTIYGPMQGLYSILRVPWLNLINFLAVYNALARYISYKLFNKPLTWAKTTHSFPKTEQLTAYQKRLGELLIEQKVITKEHLEHALNIQKKSKRKLGEILVEMGLLSEDQISKFLAVQQGLEFVEKLPEDIPQHLIEKLGGEYIAEHHLLPLRETENFIEVGFVDPPSDEFIKEVSEKLGKVVVPTIIPNSEFKYFVESFAEPSLVVLTKKLKDYGIGIEESEKNNGFWEEIENLSFDDLSSCSLRDMMDEVFPSSRPVKKGRKKLTRRTT